MKVSRSYKASAFEQPTVRGWLVVFVCGFLTVCILGAAVCLLAWLVGKGASVMKLPLHAAFPDTTALMTSARLILQGASIFGVLLATLSLFESAKRKRQEVRLPGTHPTFGDYESVPHFNTWHAKPLLPKGRSVNLNGWGEAPSESQAAQWQEFISRYDALHAAAAAGLLTPPHPLQDCRSVILTPKVIIMHQDGRLNVAFQFATVPDNFWSSEMEEPFPIAVFSPALELERAEWVTPAG